MSPAITQHYVCPRNSIWTNSHISFAVFLLSMMPVGVIVFLLLDRGETAPPWQSILLMDQLLNRVPSLLVSAVMLSLSLAIWLTWGANYSCVTADQFLFFSNPFHARNTLAWSDVTSLEAKCGLTPKNHDKFGYVSVRFGSANENLSLGLNDTDTRIFFRQAKAIEAELNKTGLNLYSGEYVTENDCPPADYELFTKLSHRHQSPVSPYYTPIP